MNEHPPPACPNCGSRQLIIHNNRRKVFINSANQRIPMLTINHHSTHPVIEENSISYTCGCTWTGSENDLYEKA